MGPLSLSAGRLKGTYYSFCGAFAGFQQHLGESRLTSYTGWSQSSTVEASNHLQEWIDFVPPAVVGSGNLQ